MSTLLGWVLSCSSVRVCVRASVRPCACASRNRITGYLTGYLTPFHHTYINDALWDRDKRVTVWGQKVTVQGHGARTIIVQAEA